MPWRPMELPKGVFAAIDKRRRLFLWTGEDSCSGSKCLVSWEEVCIDKKFGGLGIKDLAIQNTCLLMKNIYRLHVTSSPWAIWLWNEHHQQNLQLGEGNFGPHVTSLAKLLPLYQQISTVTVQNGAKTSFWKDTRLTDMPLASKFQALFSHCTKQSFSVKEMSESAFSMWHPRMSSQAQEELHALHSMLHQFQLSQHQDVRALSFQDKQGNSLSCSKLYRIMNSRPTCCPIWKFVWKNKAPPRIQFFVWLLAKDRLPTRVNLHKKNIVDSDRCEICRVSPETAEHLFFHCYLASAFGDLTKFSPNISSVKQIGTIRLPQGMHNNNSHFHVFYLLCFWKVWNHRNEVVYQKLQPSCQRLLRGCYDDAILWGHRLPIDERSASEEWKLIFVNALSHFDSSMF